MFERIRSQFKSLQKKGQHSTLRKDQVRIPMFTKKRGRIPVEGRIRSEFQSLKKQGQSSNV